MLGSTSYIMLAKSKNPGGTLSPETGCIAVFSDVHTAPRPSDFTTESSCANHVPQSLQKSNGVGAVAQREKPPPERPPSYMATGSSPGGSTSDLLPC